LARARLRLRLEERGAIYYLAYAPPVKLGKASFHLTEWHDASGQKLRGERTYRLRVPPNVPARQFWAVTVYDVNSAGFIALATRETRFVRYRRATQSGSALANAKV
jgi:hypothetical protein